MTSKDKLLKQTLIKLICIGDIFSPPNQPDLEVVAISKACVFFKTNPRYYDKPYAMIFKEQIQLIESKLIIYPKYLQYIRSSKYINNG